MPLLFALFAYFMYARKKARTSGAAPATTALRLTLDEQWTKLMGIVGASIDRTAASQRYHSAAEDQLDAAAYALGELMDDLAAIMILPARPSATLYRLQTEGTGKATRRRVVAAA